MKKALSLASAAALALSLAACGPKAENKVDAAANATEGAIAAAGSATANAADAVAAAVTPTPTGQAFVDKAAGSDAFEIAAAKLALTNGASARVKSFANDMIKAHSDSTASVKAAAASASPAITPNPTLTEDQNEDLAELGKLKGADFDKAYIEGQEEAHEDALALMRNYAKDGDIATLKAAAGAIAPVVSKHLDMIRAMEK